MMDEARLQEIEERADAYLQSFNGTGVTTLITADIPALIAALREAWKRIEELEKAAEAALALSRYL